MTASTFEDRELTSALRLACEWFDTHDPTPEQTRRRGGGVAEHREYRRYGSGGSIWWDDGTCDCGHLRVTDHTETGCTYCDCGGSDLGPHPTAERAKGRRR